MVGEEHFRKVMGEYATGVTIVASRDSAGRPVGLTVNAFTSVSLHPPTVLVCIHHEADSHDALLDAGHFGVSVLRADQGDLAWRFSRDDAEVRFDALPVVDGALGSPLIPGALAWLECRVTEVCGGMDHSIILAEVVSCETREGDPLLFFRGALTGLAP
jgi:flavin reductase (DIM6/NTAB) family NADH-FMN oxidoreductase RutF